MDYRIRRKKSGLNGTGYVEIDPGKYYGKHWRDGNLLICEEAFTISTGIIVNHNIDYTSFGSNFIPKNIGMKITAEGEDVGRRVNNLSESQVRYAL